MANALKTELHLVGASLNYDLLWNASDVKIVTMGPGEQTYRRTTVQAPFVAGEFQTSAVLQNRELSIKLRCLGADYVDLKNIINTISHAFTQFSFNLTMRIEDAITGDVLTNRTYKCYCADISLGNSGVLDSVLVRSQYQELTLTIPTQPILNRDIL